MVDEIKENTLEKENIDAASSANGSSENQAAKAFREKMAQRAEIARLAAEEKLARKDYEDLYRVKLAERENKKTEEAKRLREEEEARALKELQLQRERQIEEYLERERQAAEARNLKTYPVETAEDAPSFEENGLSEDAAEDAVSDVSKTQNDTDKTECEKGVVSEIQMDSGETDNTPEQTPEKAACVTEKPDPCKEKNNSDDVKIQINAAMLGINPPAVDPTKQPPIYPYGVYGTAQNMAGYNPPQMYPPQQSAYYPPAGTPRVNSYGAFYGYPNSAYQGYTQEPPSPVSSYDAYRDELRFQRDVAKGEYEEQKRLSVEEEYDLLREERRRYQEGANVLRARREGISATREGMRYGIDPYTPYPEMTDEFSKPKSAEPYSDIPYSGTEIPRYNVGVAMPGENRGRNTYSNGGDVTEGDGYADIDVPVYLGGENKEDEGEELVHLNKSQMYKELSKCHKLEASLVKDREKAAKAASRAEKNERIKLVIDQLSVSKELVLLAEEELLICVGAEHKGEISKHKKHLKKHICSYNKISDELFTLTDKPFARLSLSVIDEVILNKRKTIIPDVRYAGTRVSEFGETDSLIIEGQDDGDIIDGVWVTDGDEPKPIRDKDAERADQLRFLRDIEEEEARRREEAERDGKDIDELNAKNRKNARKQRLAVLEKVKRAKERDELLIEARSEYRIAKLTTKKDLGELSFSLDYKTPKRAVKDAKRGIDAERLLQRKALRYEREDNELYYRLFLLSDEEKLGRKKSVDNEILQSLRSKIEVLLGQREDLNEQLISLYDTSRNSGDGVGSQKINLVKRRHAKTVYRQQKKLARKVGKFNIPTELKEKIFELMNKKTGLVASLEGTKYKMKHMKLSNNAKKKLKREVKRLKTSVKRTNEDISYMMKKANKHNTNYKEGKNWMAWLIGSALVLLVLFVAWYFAGDLVINYVKSLISKFR